VESGKILTSFRVRGKKKPAHDDTTVSITSARKEHAKKEI
jgi:hypothetical protein